MVIQHRITQLDSYYQRASQTSETTLVKRQHHETHQSAGRAEALSTKACKGVFLDGSTSLAGVRVVLFMQKLRIALKWRFGVHSK